MNSVGREMRSLYVSQNGMAENLGQSQVLPYLRGLVRRGVEIDLVSFELASLAPGAREEIASSLRRDGIRWHPLVRTMQTPLRVKVQEAARGIGRALRTVIARRPDVIHGRSYFATAICDAVGEVSPRAQLLFDCRGMIGDEYLDCGYWTKDRIEYRLVKAYEKRLFRHSDGIVVLTRALATWLRENDVVGSRPIIEVVPCCVDMAKFRARTEWREEARKELALGDALTVLYAGSLGTWYLEPEMARFTAAVRERVASLGKRMKFVCLTPSDATSLIASLAREGVDQRDVIVRKVAPKDMPKYLCAGDAGLSFIQSCFSKKGSSPTKVAEYLACGNIAVVNGDIGDQADLANEREACVVLDDFSPSSITTAANRVVELVMRPREVNVDAAERAARKHFGLEEVGVARYARLYESLVRRSRTEPPFSRLRRYAATLA